jgi:hypothetical protein
MRRLPMVGLSFIGPVTAKNDSRGHDGNANAAAAFPEVTKSVGTVESYRGGQGGREVATRPVWLRRR